MSSSVLAAAAAVSVAGGFASGANVLSPSDFIIAIDGNRNLPGTTQVGGEGPQAAFDGSNSTKWLSFGRSFTGLIVTPAGGPAVVQSLSFAAGGDAPERDPVLYQLFGTNDAITSVNNSSGLAEAWTLIGGGPTGFNPSTTSATPRNADTTAVNIANSTAYSSYKLLFTKLRAANANPFDPVTLANGATANSIQLSEARLFSAANGGGSNVAGLPTSVVAIDQTDSFFPATERPVEAIDGSKASGSKYLNFGREGAGLIITPAAGATVIKSLQLTTANDTEARDPSAYQIFGTNSPIVSIEDSEGAAEAWTAITSGDMVLPAARNADGAIIGFDNDVAYTSYKVVFTDNKGPDTGANSIQFSELALFNTIPEPTSAAAVSLAVAALLGSRRRKL